MGDFLFYLFAALTVLGSSLVVLARNPVNGAMFMIVSFVGTAALFVLLQAYLLAVLQVLVYAGAVVVLFLFIIMLLDVDWAQRLRPAYVSLLLSASCFGLLLAGLGVLLWGGFGEVLTAPATQDFGPDGPPAASAKNFGRELFTRYMLPFQLTGLLLLVAMMGVIHLSKKPAPAAQAPSDSAS